VQPITGRIGPKISSCITFIAGVAPTMIVGGNLRCDFHAGSSGDAACNTRAPCATASRARLSSRA
jgi:hypothetical protein